jgi:hypothetical protein
VNHGASARSSELLVTNRDLVSMKTYARLSLSVFVSTVMLLASELAFGWGFWGHKAISKEAVSLLPEPIKGFYEKNMDYIVGHSSDPDLRRSAVKDEGYQHYIDLDRYGTYPNFDIPHSYKDAVKKYGEETVLKNGVVPWRVGIDLDSLSAAMKADNLPLILHLSADLSHYVADMNVPLHATQNYDGQMTGNIGVHSRWETGIPEHFGDKYDFSGVDSATYIENPVDHAFEILNYSYSLIGEIFRADSLAKVGIPRDSLYQVNRENGRKVYIYSDRYYEGFNKELHGMVESQMRRAAREVASYWYTAWVNAGKPKI